MLADWLVQAITYLSVGDFPRKTRAHEIYQLSCLLATYRAHRVDSFFGWWWGDGGMVVEGS